MNLKLSEQVRIALGRFMHFLLVLLMVVSVLTNNIPLSISAATLMFLNYKDSMYILTMARRTER